MGFDSTGFEDTGLGGDPLDENSVDESSAGDTPFGAIPFQNVPLADIDIGGRGISRPAVGPLGAAIRLARRQKFLSQAELAKVAGVHQTLVSKLELGAPNWTLFCRLAEALGGRPVVTIESVPAELRALERLRDTVW